MKNKIKKLLSILLIGILIQNSSVYAQINFQSEDNDYSTVKIQKLTKLNTKLKTYINKEINKSVKNIKDVNVKKSFNEELYIINEINKDIVSELKYANDTQFDENLAKLRNQARTFVQMKKDITSLTSSGINVYSISTEDKSKVEKNIVDMQSYYVDIIKDVLKELDNKNDIKQTGDGKFEIISNVGKITFTVEKFTNIFSMLSGDQELDYNITVGLDIKKDEKLNIPFDIIGTANFKVNIKKIGDDYYLTLSDYLISFDGINDIVKDYENKSVELPYGLQLIIAIQNNSILDTYKGKTIHFSAKNDLNGDIKLDPSAQITNLKNVLDLLSKESLLSPFKKKGDGYILSINTQTISNIAKIYGQEYTKEDIKMDVIKSRKTLSSMPLLYTETNGNPKISSEIIDKGNEVKLNIEKKGVDYSIEYSGKGITNGENREWYLYLQKGTYKFSQIFPNVSTKFSLENKIFDLSIIGNGNSFSIKGTSDESNTDLKMAFNSKELGTIKTTKDDKGNYSYSFNLKITDFSQFDTDIPAELKNQTLEINLVGKYLLEKGEFKIEKPASFIELDSLSPKKQDINIERIPTDKLPKDFTDL